MPLRMSCDVKNCAECPSSRATCTKCNDGYLLALNQCEQRCPDDDTTCKQNEYCNAESKCEACPRSMINIDQQCLCQDKAVCTASQYCDGAKCSACNETMPNCTSCSDRYHCTQCKEGYQAVSDSCQQQCGASTCASNETCSSGECVKCAENYINIDGECACRGLTPVCTEDQYCSYFGCTSCMYAMDNCKTCTGQYECTEVIKPCDDFNCQMCERRPSTCSKCNDGFSMLLDQCSFECHDGYWCGSMYICPESKTCDLCPYNMRNQAGICSCGAAICADGQYCIVGERKCQQCNINMPNCRNCSDLKTCAEPLSTCAVANCVMCEQAVGKCSKCAAGYALTGNSCVQTCGSVQCHEKEICADGICKLCAVNEINVAGVCLCGAKTHCKKGTYCSLESQCVSCSSHCKTCNGQACYACEHGYFLEDGACGKRYKTAIIAGSAVGGVVIILLIAGMLFYFFKYRKQREQAVQKAAQSATSEVAEMQQDQMYI